MPSQTRTEAAGAIGFLNKRLRARNAAPSAVPAFPDRLLWGERSVSSVANLTRADGREFLALAARMGLVATVQRFALSEANLALQRLRSGALKGAAVLEMPGH